MNSEKRLSRIYKENRFQNRKRGEHNAGTKTVEETRKQIKAWKKEGKTVGLVPTMGFLHEGHASLIKKCREQNDIVVVSDFVNPTQFGPTEDLEAYPRDFERDSKLCESLGADLIFCPEPSEMYHDPHAFVSIDTLSETLCGKTRPIHFKGVCTVVTKLFHIVAPDRAYFREALLPGFLREWLPVRLLLPMTGKELLFSLQGLSMYFWRILQVRPPHG